MKLITGSKKITLSLLWIFATILLIVFCIFPPMRDRVFSSNLVTIIAVVIAIIVISPALLVLILGKLKKEDGANSAIPTQTSKFLSIKIIMWILGAISGVAIIISTADVVALATINHSEEFAGLEFLVLMPAMVLPLLLELPFLIFLLAKKNKQAIVLLVIQGFLLALFAGALFMSKPLEVWYSNKMWEERIKYIR